LAQAPAPIGLVRGLLLERDSTGNAGELSIRTSNNQVFRFAYDAKTYFEREKERIAVGGLRPGDLLEIVADLSPESSLRYARTVHVMEPERPARARPASLGRFRAYRSPLEHIIPRGDLTFTGVVRRLTDDRMVLRTRLDGEKVILLREDTRYLADGSQVEWSTLQPNTRVFVRAGRSLDNDLEAYQVVWGEILEPNFTH
jgi:hypothetical protein